MAQRLRNIGTNSLSAVSDADSEIGLQKAPVDDWQYKDHNDPQVKSAQIDWPILTFWLTYFGIMFGILCGIISAGM
jgi:hypothetical protein